jgi:cobaltochelatase CobT
MDLREWMVTADDVNNAEAFANKLRRYLQVISKAKHQYGQKDGRLVNSSLHRVAVNIPGYSERVFKKTVKSNTLDISIGLLIDMSGSMSGTKFAHACKAAGLMQHALGNVLKLPVEVTGFSTYASSGGDLPQHFVFRKFQDQHLADHELMERLSEGAVKAMRNNLDGDALLWAYNRIKVQPTKRKLLVVFSDGSPAAHAVGGGSIVEHLHLVAKAIEKEKKVDLIGVGILDDNVERFYKQHIVIRKVAELEVKLLELLRRKIVA